MLSIIKFLYDGETAKEKIKRAKKDAEEIFAIFGK